MKLMNPVAILILILSVNAAQAVSKTCTVDVKDQKMTLIMELSDINGTNGDGPRVAASNTAELSFGTIHGNEIGPKAKENVSFDTATVRKVKIDGTVGGVIASPELMKTLIYELSLENAIGKIRTNPQYSDDEDKVLTSLLESALKTLNCYEM